jgi:hypothetical protein
LSDENGVWIVTEKASRIEEAKDVRRGVSKVVVLLVRTDLFQKIKR